MNGSALWLQIAMHFAAIAVLGCGVSHVKQPGADYLDPQMTCRKKSVQMPSLETLKIGRTPKKGKDHLPITKFPVRKCEKLREARDGQILLVEVSGFDKRFGEKMLSIVQTPLALFTNHPNGLKLWTL